MNNYNNYKIEYYEILLLQVSSEHEISMRDG